MDVERTIEFILDMQAKAEVRAAKADERMDKFDRRLEAMRKLIETGMRMLAKRDKEHAEFKKEQAERKKEFEEYKIESNRDFDRRIKEITDIHAMFPTFFGSEQEFVRERILGRFLENHEFSLGRCHALGLQQQVMEILVTAAAA